MAPLMKIPPDDKDCEAACKKCTKDVLAMLLQNRMHLVAQFTVFFLCLFFGRAGILYAQPSAWIMPSQLDPQLIKKLQTDEEQLDLYCLQQAYPQIEGLETRKDGSKWLKMSNGGRVLYSQPTPTDKDALINDMTPVADTMAIPYSLEPVRPMLADGESPGRKRNKMLLESLYGNSQQAVAKNINPVKFRGKNISLSRTAAKAFSNAVPELDILLKKQPSLAPYLESAGGFYWRKIAGENRMSPHSYGIAADFGVDVSPYWRWSKVNPHPKQKTYPAEIVRIMENHGFIWGGKWHEYDLMHYEYRPELICKAKIKGMPK